MKKIKCYLININPILLYVIILLITITSSLSWANEPLTVRFLDVGYGDAILIQSPDGINGMIDTGEPEMGMKVVQTLDGLGISHLDFLVLTHSHLNHFGGLEAISEQVEVRQVYVNDERVPGDEGYVKLLSKLKDNTIPVKVLKYEEQIKIGNVDTQLKVLHPHTLTGSHNADSLSLLLTYGQTQFWFTADIQPTGQHQVMIDFPEVLEADCIQVPHHGGRLNELFKSMNKDQLFVLSTGENIYGKPLDEFLNILPGRLLRTDQHGDIVITSDGQSIEVTHE